MKIYVKVVYLYCYLSSFNFEPVIEHFLEQVDTYTTTLSSRIRQLCSEARGGGAAAPHWPEKYAKYHVFSAFEADICSKNENSPPQCNWRAEVVKDLL